jgi:hypothetical protein
MPNEFIARNGITSLGNVIVTGSLTTTGTINMSGSIASASFATNASTASSADNLLVRNTLTAQTLVVQTITSSVDFVTGSTRFGSIAANTHQFTGSMGVSGSAIFNHNDAPTIRIQRNGGTDSNTVIEFTNTSRNFYIGSNGTVMGLGGTSGAINNQPLQISSTGATTFSGTLTVNNEGIVVNRGAGNGYLIFQTSGTDIGSIYSNTGGGIRLRNATSDVLTITSTGDATFSSNVTVGGNTVVQSGSVLSIFRTDNTRALQLYTTVNECVIDSWEASSEPLMIRSNGSGGRIVFHTSGSEKVRITSAGNVGINSTNPGRRLVVVGGNGNQLELDNTGQTYTQQFWKINGTEVGTIWASTSEFHMYTYGSQPILFSTNNIERIRMTNTALVLNANNSSMAYYIEVNRNSTQDGGIILQRNRSNDWQIVNDSNGNYTMYSYGVGATVFQVNRTSPCLLIGKTTTASFGTAGWQLDSSGTGLAVFAVNNNEAFIFNNINTGTTYEIDFRTNAIERGKISVTDSGVSYATQASDLNLKKNFEDWNENVLNNFKNLNPQKFNFITEEDDQPKTKGFIAQELVESFPEAYPKSKDRYFFNPSGMVVYLMKAIQELEARVQELENK